jgi:hypothetical protein
MSRWRVFQGALLALLMSTMSAHALAAPPQPDKARPKQAAEKAKPEKRRPEKPRAEPATIPVQIGLGPSAYFITGPIQSDQVPHYGLRIYAKAIIEGENLKRAAKKAPKKYQKYVKGLNEARIGHILVPDALIISPKTKRTSIYGATWRPVSVGFPLIDKGVNLSVGAGLMLTYAYFNTTGNASTEPAALPASTTHFLRPGIDLRAELEVPLGDTFLVSTGWSSGLYVPQRIGGGIGTVGPLNEALWHFGQAYALLNVRIPFETSF